MVENSKYKTPCYNLSHVEKVELHRLRMIYGNTIECRWEVLLKKPSFSLHEIAARIVNGSKACLFNLQSLLSMTMTVV